MIHVESIPQVEQVLIMESVTAFSSFVESIPQML